MSANNILTPVVVASMAAVVGLATIMVALDPTRLGAAVIGAGFLPVAVLLIKTIGRSALACGDVPATFRILRASLVGAAVILAGSLAVEIGELSGFIGREGRNVEEIVFGVSLAGAMVLLGWVTERASLKP
jgi:uncharacterized membrane protein